MPSRRLTDLWGALGPELRSRLAHAPHRPLSAEEVDELARAGAREAHAIWFESRAGRTRQWSTTWEFRHFVEAVGDVEAPVRRPAEKRWTELLRPSLRP